MLEKHKRQSSLNMPQTWWDYKVVSRIVPDQDQSTIAARYSTIH